MMTLLRPDLLILIDFPDFNLRVAKNRKTDRNSGFILYQPADMGLAFRKGQDHCQTG